MVGVPWAAGADTGEARTLDCSDVLVAVQAVPRSPAPTWL